MEQSTYKLVALDLDGTVLDSEQRISDRLKALTARLAGTGVRMVLCTGRRWRTTLPVLQEMAHAHPIAVCTGGALIKEADEHRTLYINPVSEGTSRRAVALFRTAGLVPFVLVDRPLERSEVLIAELDRPRAERLPYIVRNQRHVEYYSGEFPALKEPVLDVYTLDCAERIRAHANVIRTALGADAILTELVQPAYSEQIALETHAPTATKWSALGPLLDRWGIAPAEVVAVGDDANDIPMLRAAGLSFAMGNASDAVKAAADRVTAGNNEDGVSRALTQAFPHLA